MPKHWDSAAGTVAICLALLFAFYMAARLVTIIRRTSKRDDGFWETVKDIERNIRKAKTPGQLEGCSMDIQLLYENYNVTRTHADIHEQATKLYGRLQRRQVAIIKK